MSNRIRSVGLWHSLMLNSCFLTPSYNTHVQGGRLSLFLPMVESHDLCEAESPKAMCNVMAIGYDWSWPTTVQIPLWEVRCDNCRLVTRQVLWGILKEQAIGCPSTELCLHLLHCSWAGFPCSLPPHLSCHCSCCSVLFYSASSLLWTSRALPLAGDSVTSSPWGLYLIPVSNLQTNGVLR